MPAISPISFTNLEGELRLSQMISMELFSLLNDSGSLRNTPYMTYVGSINGMGSDTIRVKLAGLGRTAMAAAPEQGVGSAVAASNFDVNHADVIVGRQAVSYTHLRAHETLR